MLRVQADSGGFGRQIHPGQTQSMPPQKHRRTRGLQTNRLACTWYGLHLLTSFTRLEPNAPERFRMADTFTASLASATMRRCWSGWRTARVAEDVEFGDQVR